MTDEDSSPLPYIKAFFDDLDAKVAFLDVLWGTSHQDEALTLCCCYIDGLANHYRKDDDSSARNFATTLVEYGGEPSLALHTGLALSRALRSKGQPKSLATAAAVETALDERLGELVSASELAARLKAAMPPNVFQALAPHLWRASVASIAYLRLRSPFIHELGGPGAVIVGSSDHRADNAIHVGFPMLQRALKNLVRTMRERSETTVSWFGHEAPSRQATPPANEA